jgi:hypothetical protein
LEPSMMKRDGRFGLGIRAQVKGKRSKVKVKSLGFYFCLFPFAGAKAPESTNGPFRVRRGTSGWTAAASW